MRSDWLRVVVTGAAVERIGNPGGPSAPNPGHVLALQVQPGQAVL